MTKELEKEQEEAAAVNHLSQPVQIEDERREQLAKENSKNMTKEPEKEDPMRDLISQIVRKIGCQSAEESSQTSSAVENWEEGDKAGKR